MHQLRAEQNHLYCRTWFYLLCMDHLTHHWMFQVFIYSLKLGAEIVLLSSPCPRLFTSYLHLLWFIMPHFYLFFIWKAIAPVGNKQLCYLTCPKLTQKICTLKPIQNSVNGKLNVFMPFYIVWHIKFKISNGDVLESWNSNSSPPRITHNFASLLQHQVYDIPSAEMHLPLQ